jgi:hypothetical protein
LELWSACRGAYLRAEFLLAHERWESVLLTLEELVKSFLQALIQMTSGLVLKLRFRNGQDVLFPRDPHIERGKKKDANGKGPNQAPDYDYGERPL